MRYRSADTIYLDAGQAAGIAVGDRLQVLRGNEVIAEIEVIFAAERSASARVVSERQPIQKGDRARLAAGAGAPGREPATAPQRAPGTTTAPQEPPATAPRPQQAPGTAPAPQEPPTTADSPTTRPPARPAEEPRFGTGGRRRLSRTRIAGAVTFDWESASGGEDEGRDSDRTAVRLSLRARDLGGSPLQLRLRARSLEVSRDRTLTSGIPARESRDRLYEAALIYDEPENRFALRLGRLGASPFVGLGYVDGALGEVRLLRGIAVGALYGRRPDEQDLGLDAAGTKAGAFVRLGSRAEGSRRGFEVLLAGIREEPDSEAGIGRDYVTLESRFGPGERWSVFQNAEVDLDSAQLGRFEAESEETQLSMASLTALGRLSGRRRVAVTYDYFQRYPTEDDLLTPEELFDRLWRQGLRVSWQTDREGGLHLSLGGGLRRREESIVDPRFGIAEAQQTYSLSAGAHHPRLPGLGLSAGIDLTGYSSSSLDGLLVSTRVGRRLGAGHEIGFSLGGNVHRTDAEEERVLAWGRASLWLELPLDLFGEAEIEVLQGDEDVEGRRLRLGLGYRF